MPNVDVETIIIKANNAKINNNNTKRIQKMCYE